MASVTRRIKRNIREQTTGKRRAPKPRRKTST
jgi:hypothetical protein